MPSLTREDLLEFLEHVDREARPRATFYGLIFLASVIATFGLLANSAAVIIGAMLIAPLMNAIVGMALAVVLNERGLLRRSATALVTGAALAWGTGAVLSWLSPVVDPGSEILSRVRPTTFDLWVATAAGLAGAYSLLRARSSAALPGVAIATAVVPPLVAAGIETRLLDFGGALGALLLFVSNLVAIACGSMAIFAAFGLSRLDVGGEKARPLRRYAWWSGSFVVVLLVLSHSLSEVIRESRMQNSARKTLESQLRMVPGATLDRYTLRHAREGLRIDAVVSTPNSVGPPMVAAAERLLAARLDRPVQLMVRSVITKDADAREYRLGEATTPPPAREGAVAIIERTLREQALALEEAVLYDYSLRRDGAGYRVVALYRSRYQVDPLVARGIRNLLAEAVGKPIDLRLSVIPPELAPLPRERDAPTLGDAAPDPVPAARDARTHTGRANR